MGLLITILIVLFTGIWIGFLIGFSKAMRQAARQMNRPRRTTIARFLIGGGSICLVIALGTFVYSWRFVSTARPATGMVSELREQKDKESGRVSFAPTFMFRDAGGKQFTTESSVFSSQPRYRVGDFVPILYQPKSPAHARIDSYLYFWALPTIAGIVGALNFSIGLFIWYWPRIIARFKREGDARATAP